MDAVEDIKSRLSIEDVIGQYVELKRAGRNLKGLSPFGSERTPSFMVSPEKQIWHDFSSGKGGNMFSFVMEMEGVDFKGALEILARKAGIDIDQYRGRMSSSAGKKKERLFEALELATRFYQRNLINNKAALEYVGVKRQFTKQTIYEWRLGYSPETGTALVDFLRQKKFTMAEIRDAGLSSKGYGGARDMFRGRLMIPLQDPQGRVIGFTARLLRDNPNAPKYINTPQTLLYDKSRHVFGWHLAKEAVRTCKYVVITEGNLDVIQSHQAGVRQVVATAGTALTEHHLKTFNYFSNDIRLCFDADNAGLNATERAIPIANKLDISLTVLSIPAGKDPDELIKKDPKLWEQTIENKQDVLDWLIHRYQDLSDLTTDRGRRNFKAALLGSLQSVDSPGEQANYAAKIAKILDYSAGAEAILAEMQSLHAKKSEPRPSRLPEKTPTVRAAKPAKDANQESKKAENHLLAIALLQPKLRTALAGIKPQMLAQPEARDLLAFLAANPDFRGDPEAADSLRPLADYVKMLSLLYEELYQDLDGTELRYEVAGLQSHLIKLYVKTQKKRIARELQTSDDARTAALLEAANRLDNLLRTTKEAHNAEK